MNEVQDLELAKYADSIDLENRYIAKYKFGKYTIEVEALIHNKEYIESKIPKLDNDSEILIYTLKNEENIIISKSLYDAYALIKSILMNNNIISYTDTNNIIKEIPFKISEEINKLLSSIPICNIQKLDSIYIQTINNLIISDFKRISSPYGVVEGGMWFFNNIDKYIIYRFLSVIYIDIKYPKLVINPTVDFLEKELNINII